MKFALVSILLSVILLFNVAAASTQFEKVPGWRSCVIIQKHEFFTSQCLPQEKLATCSNSSWSALQNKLPNCPRKCTEEKEKIGPNKKNLAMNFYSS